MEQQAALLPERNEGIEVSEEADVDMLSEDGTSDDSDSDWLLKHK